MTSLTWLGREERGSGILAKWIPICLGTSAAVAFFASCIWYDFLTFCAGLNFNREIVFAYALAAAGAGGIVQSRYRNAGWFAAIALYFVLMAALHITLGLPPASKNVSMYVAPVAAFLFLSLDRRVMLWLLIGTLICSTLIEVHEFYTLRYWFVWKDENIVLDAYQYTANQGMFRAKGLFSGPLNGYDFGLLTLLLSSLSPLVIVLVALGSILAATKSGIVVSAGMLVLRYLDVRRLALTAYIGAGLVCCFLVVTQLIRLHAGQAEATDGTPVVIQQQNILEYLWRTVDPRVPSTIFRINSVLKGISDFGGFSSFHMLFGDPNFAYRVPDAVHNGGVESSAIKELQDYGIIGFLIAAAVKCAVFVRLLRSSKKMAAAFAIYYSLTIVSPIYTPLGLSMLFWLFMFQALQAGTTSTRST